MTSWEAHNCLIRTQDPALTLFKGQSLGAAQLPSTEIVMGDVLLTTSQYFSN